eukprot:1791738-Pyramimonas_sp.AAC.1
MGLRAVKHPSDPTCISHDSATMTDRLMEHWAPIFSAKPIDLNRAQAYIEQHVPILDLSKVAPPSPALLRRVANKMHRSEPGLDSIPHSAWVATDV